MRVSGHIPGPRILQRIEPWAPIFELYGSKHPDSCIMHRAIRYEHRLHCRFPITFIDLMIEHWPA
jgi:hypothetical protein